MSAPSDPRTVRLDARQIRVLAHPLRAKLIGRLRIDGAATATRLAEVLGTNTGATSYHLRRLAAAGLVVEDEHTARGRERWWRSAYEVSSWWRRDFDGDSDAEAAADWLHSYATRGLAEHAEAWQRAAVHESAAWRDAAGLSDYLLRLDPAQLRALTGELHEVIERHRKATADAPAPDARRVALYLYGAPYLAPS